MTPIRVLREVFGHAAFREGQRLAIQGTLAGRDVQVLLPTGGGKSVCYQVPAVVRAARGEGLTLVVSPLIALMEDQVASLRQRGVAAEVLLSGVSWADQRAIMDRAASAALLYVSPERVGVKRFRAWLSKIQLAAVAVDEANCISEWGHDFRKDYLGLGVLKESFSLPTMALTATATPRVLEEIRNSLGMRAPLRIAGSFRRPNLSMWVELHEGDKIRVERLIALLEERGLGRDAGAGRVVVYAATRKRVKAIGAALKRAKIRAGTYHAGRTGLARERAQGAFLEGRVPVLVATTAFGMGIDQPDVRLVAHLQAPGSLEAYYQQAGRAGRDGAPADCVMLYSPGDSLTQRRLRGETPTPGAEAGWKALQDYIYGTRCRQAAIDLYFQGLAGPPCGICDVCADAGRVYQAVDGARERLDARRARRVAKRAEEDAVILDAPQLDAVVSFVEGLRKPVGKTLVAQGLRGSHSKRTKRAKLQDNPWFGALKGVPERAIVRAVDGLLDAKRLAPRGRKYPTVWIPDKRVRPATPKKKAVSKPAPRGLTGALKAFRRAQARKRRWRAYQVMTDATIDGIVAARPRDLEALGAVKGMGPKRIAKFGEAILDLVSQYA